MTNFFGIRDYFEVYVKMGSVNKMLFNFLNNKILYLEPFGGTSNYIIR